MLSRAAVAPRHAFAALGVSAALLVLSPASASALVRGFPGAFGSASSTPADPYPLSSPSGVAVNEVTSGDVGDVYVVDKGNNRVEQFSATGTFILMFGKEVNETKVKASAPEAEQNVCTQVEIEAGEVCKAGTAGPGAGELSSPEWIAVDNSGNGGDPSNGDVYVVNTGDNTIQKFTANGAYVGELTETESGSLFKPLDGVAVDQNGSVWVFQSEAIQESERIDEFTDALVNTFVAPATKDPRGTKPGFAVDSEGAFYVDTGGGKPAKLNGLGEQIIEEVGGDNASGLAVNLDPSSSEFDDVYVDNSTRVAIYNSAPECTAMPHCGMEPEGSLVARFPEESVIASGGRGSLTDGTGIAVDGATGIVYVADAGKNDVAVSGFGNPPSAPVTEEASEITPESATLNGKLEPPATKLGYYFEYNAGASCAFGSKTTAKEGEGKVSEEVKGLEPSTLYTFCLWATNPFGTTQGAAETFTTAGVAATAETSGVSELTDVGATLHGEVDPFNQETSYSVEYSTHSNLENATTVAGAAPIPPHLHGVQSVSVATTPVLTPETTYYYRFVAQNGTGGPVTALTIQQFTTLPLPPTATTEGSSQITVTGASVAGTVLPGSSGPNSDTQWYFQYGTSTSYGEVGGAGDAGRGSTPVAVATALAGLTSNTTYHYRLAASNSNQDPGVTPQLAYGSDRAFTTLPADPLVGQPSGLSETAATLNGHVNPDGHALEYRFEYGTSTTYGHSTPVESAGEGAGYTPVSSSLTGLAAGVAYHYRLVAIGTGGDSASSDVTFTLNPPTPETAGNPFNPGPTAPAPFTALPLLGLPTFPPVTETPPPPSKPPSTAQKLAKALKQCKKDKKKNKRVKCESEAHKKYRTNTNTKAKKTAKHGGRS